MRKISIGFCLVVAALGCRSGSTEGCTPENCRLMLACRVELVGGPSAACWQSAPAPAGFDTSKYCVEDCRAQGAGDLVACIAGRAARCDAATDSQTQEQIAEECQAGSSGGPSGSADVTCSAPCDATRETCDEQCVARLDAGFVACTDCSADCGRAWLDCTDRCGN